MILSDPHLCVQFSLCIGFVHQVEEQVFQVFLTMLGKQPVNRSHGLNAAPVDDRHPLAQPHDLVHRVRGKDDRLATILQLPDFLQ